MAGTHIHTIPVTDNFIIRLKTGFWLIVMLSLLIYSGAYSFLMVIFLIKLLSLFEFYRLFNTSDIKVQKWTGMLLSSVLFISSILVSLGGFDQQLLLINIPLISLFFLKEMYSHHRNPFQNISVSLLGVIFISLPLILFSLLAFSGKEISSYKDDFTLSYFIILWASDSGAYMTGKLAGKHKLAPRISPGKTWEGSIGGALSALITAALISVFIKDIDIMHWVLIAMIIVITGTLGDLSKSMLKRSVGVKDSGKLLPGHGGMLDRFDSLIGSAAYVYIYMQLADLI